MTTCRQVEMVDRTKVHMYLRRMVVISPGLQLPYGNLPCLEVQWNLVQSAGVCRHLTDAE